MDKEQTVIKTLDILALALANQGHQWTEEERRLYERAIALLT